jgi:molybdenum cofactor cytidylyltransferase
MTNDIVAIILAAGQSRRMGWPKMLLPWGSGTVLSRVVEIFAEAGFNDILVVTGGAREQVEAEVMHLAGQFPVRSVFNPAYAKGEMLSSLQRGLAAIPDGCSAALIGLGDQPQVEVRIVHDIVRAFDSSTAQIIVPSFERHRGHPWLVRSSLWPVLLELHSPQTPRDFLIAHEDAILYVNVDTPTILQDLDTPEDYQRYH